ncbi:MAG: hypothetical protein Q8N84_02825 [bacterium]|nr:hypothetical protein [bacterium]
MQRAIDAAISQLRASHALVKEPKEGRDALEEVLASEAISGLSDMAMFNARKEAVSVLPSEADQLMASGESVRKQLADIFECFGLLLDSAGEGALPSGLADVVENLHDQQQILKELLENLQELVEGWREEQAEREAAKTEEARKRSFRLLEEIWKELICAEVVATPLRELPIAVKQAIRGILDLRETPLRDF